MHVRSRFAPAIALITFLSPFSINAAEEPLPKAEAVLDKCIEATGGKDAYRKVHNEKWSGTIELIGKGVKGKITSYRVEPRNTYTAMELDGVGLFEDGNTGDTAWTRNVVQGPRIKQGDERASAFREATFGGLLHWRDLYKAAETTGVETVGDQVCYKVVMTPNEGKPETCYFDKKSGFLVKMTMIADGDEQPKIAAAGVGPGPEMPRADDHAACPQPVPAADRRG